MVVTSMTVFQQHHEWVGPDVVVGVVQSNIVNTCNWSLTDEEFAAITNIKHQLRLLDGCPWLHEVGPYRYLQLLAVELLVFPSGCSFCNLFQTVQRFSASRKLQDFNLKLSTHAYSHGCAVTLDAPDC